MSNKLVKDYNAETIFPFSLLDELVHVLKEKKAVFKTYEQLNLTKSILPDPYKYFKEFVEFKYCKTNFIKTILFALQLILEKKKINLKLDKLLNKNTLELQVIFHHDADRQLYKTIDMMKRENQLGVKSSNFFFYQRNIWDEDKETYDLLIEDLKELEGRGFEIGYHLNAYELANYDLEEAFKLINRDIAFFKKNFNLKGFVPHGGVRGKNEINNDYIPNKGILKKLNWYYNGRSKRGVLKDKTWSDGGIYMTTVVNPIKIAQNLKAGERLLILMHPQYYGYELMKDWEKLPISKEKWWRDLWDL